MSEVIDKELDKIESDFLEQEEYLQTKISYFETEKSTKEEMDNLKNSTKMKVLDMHINVIFLYLSALFSKINQFIPRSF
jgi:hypothetical protein